MPTIYRRVSVTYSPKEVIELINEVIGDDAGEIESRNDSIKLTFTIPKRAFSDAAKEDSNYASDNRSNGDLTGDVSVDECSGSVTVLFDDET